MAYPTNALIVDDEAHVRAFLRLLLREIGVLECREAADGATAIQLARQQIPGLVLLDVNMPGLSGLQVLEQLMTLDPEIPVVMVTSQSAITTVNEAVKLGAVGYLLKHSPKEKTQQALREVLDSVAEGEPDSA